MKPYIIKSVEFYTYGGRRFTIDVEPKIYTKPFKIMEEKFLDDFKDMDDFPVKAKLNVKYV